MRPIWKGSISFGLVVIPISLYPATKREELKFRMLRSSDQSPINYKRVAETDGKEVPWDQIVKGYEYEKGRFVILKDEDFARVDVEATQTVDIMNFVEQRDINPLLFSKPYYMQPEKGGDKAYVLLRDALEQSKKVGIAKVVIKARQHLAAIKPQGRELVLELMHFPEEIIDSKEFEPPSIRNLSKAEMNMAVQLIESMTDDWDPGMYKDDYQDALRKVIDEKIEAGDRKLPPLKKVKPTNVIDLASMLEKSLRETQKGGRAPKNSAPKPRKRAA